VGFRYSCRHEALSRGVTGWVRNRSDGAVEADFEGEPDSVEAMCTWCQRGPRHARVASVEVAEREVAGSAGFEIRW
jgi:acylphosphatase